MIKLDRNKRWGDKWALKNQALVPMKITLKEIQCNTFNQCKHTQNRRQKIELVFFFLGKKKFIAYVKSIDIFYKKRLE